MSQNMFLTECNFLDANDFKSEYYLYVVVTCNTSMTDGRPTG